MPLDIVHEAGEGIGPCGPAAQAGVKADRHHFGLPLALAIEPIKRGLK